MSNKKTKLRLRKGRAAALLVVLVSFISFLCYCTWRRFNPIRFISTPVSAELGSAPNPKNWIASVWHGDADDVKVVGNVDTSQIGTQNLTFDLNGQQQNLPVNIIDTTAPHLEVKDVETGIKDEVDPESFVTECTDLSRTTLSIADPSSIREYVPGTYDVTITAMDEYGNRTSRKARLTRKELGPRPHEERTVPSEEEPEENADDQTEETK